MKRKELDAHITELTHICTTGMKDTLSKSLETPTHIVHAISLLNTLATLRISVLKVELEESVWVKKYETNFQARR